MKKKIKRTIRQALMDELKYCIEKDIMFLKAELIMNAEVDDSYAYELLRKFEKDNLIKKDFKNKNLQYWKVNKNNKLFKQ